MLQNRANLILTLKKLEFIWLFACKTVTLQP